LQIIKEGIAEPEAETNFNKPTFPARPQEKLATKSHQPG
jgi:hypothetical protein